MSSAREKLYTTEDIYAMHNGTRAELINGHIYYMAPPTRNHQKIISKLNQYIANYIDSSNDSCEVYPAPFAVFLNNDDMNYVEPDISVICDKNKLDNRGCHGAPDWIIEIVSPSNSSHDYIRKLNLYADAGVREYWIVNPVEQSIFVYHLETDSFQVKYYTFRDKIKVNIYDDLWIDFQEITL